MTAILVLTLCFDRDCREQALPIDATLHQCMTNGAAVMATAAQHAQPGERLARWRCEVVA